MRIELGSGDKNHPYTVRFHDHKIPNHNFINTPYYDMKKWCDQNFKGRCVFTLNWIWFKTEEDRSWFLMRWLDKT